MTTPAPSAALESGRPLERVHVRLRDAEKLRELLAKSHQTHEQVAAAAGMSRARLLQIMRVPSSYTTAAAAVTIAAAVDADVVDLFEFPAGDALKRLGLVE
jgi:transcriptional regulator with XRE-family HTH domain